MKHDTRLVPTQVCVVAVSLFALTGVCQGRKVFAPSFLRRPPLRRLRRALATLFFSGGKFVTAGNLVTDGITISQYRPYYGGVLVWSGTILVHSIVRSSSPLAFWQQLWPNCQSDVFRTHITQCNSTLGCLRDAALSRLWRPNEEELFGESVARRRDPLLWHCLLLVAVSQCLVSAVLLAEFPVIDETLT